MPLGGDPEVGGGGLGKDPEAHEPARESDYAPPSVGEDVVKSGGSGVASGFTQLAGLPGDVANLFPESWRDAPDKRLPTSEDTQKAAEKVTGKFYEPQTTAGKYAHTIGQFAPGVIGGPGGLTGRALRYAVAPGLATEAAGQAAQAYAPELEPYVRAGTALATGTRLSTKKGEFLSHDDMKAAAQRHYEHPEVKDVVITPEAASKLKSEIDQAMNKHTREYLAGPVYKMVGELKNPLYPSAGAFRKGAVSIDDIDAVRQLLNRERMNFGPNAGHNRLAADIAIDKIDDFLANLKQPDLVRGNADLANKHMLDARANWAAGKRMEATDDKLVSALLRAESTYSGHNVENAIRQNFRNFVDPTKNKKLAAGWTKDELDRVRQIVKGGHIRDILRETGNRLGGNMGAWAAMADGVLLRDPTLAALWGVGRVVKGMGNWATRRQAEGLSRMLSERAPEGRLFRKMHPLPRPSADRAVQIGVGLGQPGMGPSPEQFKKGGRVKRSFNWV